MNEYNPFDPAMRADPYPVLRELRSQEPVHPSGFIEGSYLLTRYADVLSVLRSPRASADRSQATAVQQLQQAQPEELGPLGGAQTMLTADPPDHTRLRTLVSKAFTPQAVEAMRPRIQRLVDELLDAVAQAGRMDIVADLAYPLPVIVIAEMLGVAPEDRERFKRWSDDIAVTLDPIVPPEALERAQVSAQELVDYLREVVGEHRASPRQDLIGALIAAEEQGDRLTEDELYATCMLLLVAGNETTTNLIGNGMLALLRHPDQLARLRDDPSLIEPAVEELLRFDSPVQATARVALDETEMDGQTVRPGELFVTHLAAANRDPAQFPDPDRLDIARSDNRHVAFGYGVHFCLGAPLARVEGQLAIGTLVRRFAGLRLLTEEPEWRETVILRGLKALPVAFGEGGAS